MEAPSEEQEALLGAGPVQRRLWGAGWRSQLGACWGAAQGLWRRFADSRSPSESGLWLFVLSTLFSTLMSAAAKVAGECRSLGALF